LSTTSQKGIQDGWAFDDQLQPLLTPAVARTMRELGAKWVRLHFRLNATHPRWDEPILQAYERAVQTLRKENIQILGLATYESHPGSQTDWIQNNAEVDGGSGDNPYLRTWASQTFRTLMTRFPTVTTWEVWNEPNCWTTNPPGDKDKLPGQFYIYPSNFAWLLSHAHDEAVKMKPPRQIVSGGLLGADFIGEPVSDTAVPYLRDTFKMGREKARWGATPPVDGWGLHLYIRSGSLCDPAYFAKFPSAFQEELDKLDPRRKPIWLTEVGWQTDPGGLSEEDQAKNVTMLMKDIAGRSQFGPLFFFKLRDEPDLRFGLQRTDGSPKPAFEAFKRAK
jgi:hypothetical protein